MPQEAMSSERESDRGERELLAETDGTSPKWIKVVGWVSLASLQNQPKREKVDRFWFWTAVLKHGKWSSAADPARCVVLRRFPINGTPKQRVVNSMSTGRRIGLASLGLAQKLFPVFMDFGDPVGQLKAPLPMLRAVCHSPPVPILLPRPFP